MDKLTLEHLAPYLPYETPIMPLYRVMSMGLGYNERTLSIDVIHYFQIEDIKPVLRPLSDLTESDLFKNWNKEHSIELRYSKRVLLDVSSSTCIDIVGYPLSFLTDLIKNHFDVFGLIEKGLAVDINTI